MATPAAPQSALENAVQFGTAANPAQSDDPTPQAPETRTAEQIEVQQKLDERCKAALLELRRTFKMRYQPKRMRFISEAMRAFEAFRGNTYALLNDQSAALDTINQLMQGFLGQGDDPQLYAHNDNIYQAFALIFIAALMVDLGKVRYQPADADDDEDLAIARKGSLIQEFNERKNDSASLMQLKLLYFWLLGSFFRYTAYKVDDRAGTSKVPQIELKPTKIAPDGYVCPNCGNFVQDSKAMIFGNHPRCPNCGTDLDQKNWFEGPMLDLPVQVGEIEAANGMTAMTITNGLCVDVNPDAIEDPIRDTEILDYSIEVSPGKVRAAFPAMYSQIMPSQGTDASSDGDAARMARSGQTTPGSNNRPITADGVGTYSRCWYNPVAFSELQEEDVAKELLRKYPNGCKLSLWGSDLILKIQAQDLRKHWTWCGMVKGLGPYPPAVGKVVLDVQERVTGAVNKVDAYMDRVAFGTILYDADYIDGNAMSRKVLTPGNMTGVSRTDEETGEKTALSDLIYQPTLHIDPEIYKYIDTLTVRAQFLCGVMPQIFGGSDKHVETAHGQAQALNTAMGRLKQYILRMRAEDAEAARIGVKCSIDNMDEEVKIVQQGDTANTWQTIRLLKAELTGDFFTYPETDEGYPETFAEIQERLMTLLADPQKVPFLEQVLSDPDIASAVWRYVGVPQIKLTAEPERAKIKTIIHRLSQDKNGPVLMPNPQNPGGPAIVIPSISPTPDVDDPGVCQVLAKKWLQENWEQETTNPKGFANVLAFLKISAQMAREQQAAQAITMAQQASKVPPRGQRQLG